MGNGRDQLWRDVSTIFRVMTFISNIVLLVVLVLLAIQMNACTVTEPVKPTCITEASDGKVYYCDSDSLVNNNAAVGRGGFNDRVQSVF